MTERLSRQRLEELRFRWRSGRAGEDGRIVVCEQRADLLALLNAAERDLDALAAPLAEPEQPHWPTVAATLREVARATRDNAFAGEMLRRARDLGGGREVSYAEQIAFHLRGPYPESDVPFTAQCEARVIGERADAEIAALRERCELLETSLLEVCNDYEEVVDAEFGPDPQPIECVVRARELLEENNRD